MLADFTKITRVIEENPLMVHTSNISPATRMLLVFVDSTMVRANVSSLLLVFLEMRVMADLSLALFRTLCLGFWLPGGDDLASLLTNWRSLL